MVIRNDLIAKVSDAFKSPGFTAMIFFYNVWSVELFEINFECFETFHTGKISVGNISSSRFFYITLLAQGWARLWSKQKDIAQGKYDCSML